METAIGGIIVFPLALRALFEYRHAGIDSIIGNAAHNAQTWAAMGAINKWIAVTTVVGIKQFL